MEVFWIVVGVVAVIIYVINQNKTKISDRTVVNHNKTIKTEDGEITINRTQVIEHTSTQFQKTGGNAPNISAPPAYDSAVIQTYYKQQELAKERQLIQPKPFTAELPPGVSTRPAYHGRFLVMTHRLSHLKKHLRQYQSQQEYLLYRRQKKNQLTKFQVPASSVCDAE